MKKANNIIEVNWKTYILPLVLISVLFIIAGYFIIKSIQSNSIRVMVEHSTTQSDQYANKVSTSNSANKTIENYLDEKLVVATNVILSNQNKINNDYLAKMIEELKVNQIYWFNSTGKIIHTGDDYLGWQAFEGSPTYEFMKSGEDSLIEEVRQDSSSDVFYKFAFQRSNNGNFVQVGILAEDIYQLSRKFCPEEFITDLRMDGSVLDAYIIEEVPISSLCNIEEKADYLLSEKEQQIVNDKGIYAVKEKYDTRDAYKVIIPIHVDNQRTGTIVIYYDLEATYNVIYKSSFIALGFLALIFLVYAIMMIVITKKNRRIKVIAYYDERTGLLNRSYFQDYLAQRLRGLSKENHALILIQSSNLDLVKMIHGNEKYNELIAIQAERLSEINWSKQFLFKFNEDSFVMYINNYLDENTLNELSDHILSELNCIADTLECGRLVTNKIGILLIDENQNSVNKVINRAEIMLNDLNKMENEGTWSFNEINKQKFMQYESMKTELREAINFNISQEFYLDYQPQINARTNKVIGFEALVRWNNESLGFVRPDKFISIAEKTQLIIPLGNWILRQACLFIKELEAQGDTAIKVAVNISVVQLLQESFVEDVISIMAKTEINPENLELEVTESSFIGNYQLINDKLDALVGLGIQISLDDFGTGYSSLVRLQSLNIHTIKIDKVFIDNLGEIEQKNVIVKSIILLAEQLGLCVIAEGVETSLQKDYLLKEGCNVIQGYLFSKPLSRKDSLKFIDRTFE